MTELKDVIIAALEDRPFDVQQSIETIMLDKARAEIESMRDALGTTYYDPSDQNSEEDSTEEVAGEFDTEDQEEVDLVDDVEQQEIEDLENSDE